MARVAKVKRSGGGGLGHVAKRAKEIDAKRAAGKKNWLASKMGDGDSVVLRVLDTGADFKDGYVHPVDITYEDDDGKTQEIIVDVMCLDQDEQGEPCPGCSEDLDRRYKFWTNVIAREWSEDGGEEEDTLMIWSGGIKLAKRLDKLNQRHDLRSRDLLLERDGVKLNTEWTVDWAEDEDTPLTENDEKLAKNKHDLSRYVKIREFDDFYKSNKELGDDDTEDVGEKTVKRGSAFGEKKGKVGAKTRRTATKGSKTGLAAVKARADGKSKGKVKAKSTAKPKLKVKRRS